MLSPKNHIITIEERIADAKPEFMNQYSLWLVLLWLAVPVFAQSAAPLKVPGAVIDYSPASSGIYIGSPGLAVLPNGDYVASHDEFGPKTGEHEKATTHIFRSNDKGKTWQKIATIKGAFWSSLFVHRSALYLLGTDKHHGNTVIRRSQDGGITWTEPKDAKSGLLRADGQYHCAPMPVIEHKGRLWRAFERRDPPTGWGTTYCAGIFSVPVDVDLLDADNWTVSNFLPSERTWNNNDMGGWLEGNAVVMPDGNLVDVLRVDTKSPDEKAAIVKVSEDGKTMSFNPETGFVTFPGGAKKFAIRFDEKSKLYWSLSSIVPDIHRGPKPGGVRNALALIASPDLQNWTVRSILLYHPDVARHGFQYVEWLFEGDDIIAACRTAYDDGQGGAHNNHDANYLTFHRFSDFRNLHNTMLPVLRAASAQFEVTGANWTLGKLADGERAFGNRDYVWRGVPEHFKNWRITQTRGGEKAIVRLKATQNTSVFVLTSSKTPLQGWQVVPSEGLHYTDAAKTPVTIYSRIVQAGESIELPQTNWMGTSVLLPPE